ncbi:MAG: C40 family peptidase [Alphaproteobacteria bacterium]|nr:C40 family peptidase [Alphaproteobacteria bacterium]
MAKNPNVVKNGRDPASEQDRLLVWGMLLPVVKQMPSAAIPRPPLINQLVFGESVQVITHSAPQAQDSEQDKKNWAWIRSEDGYEGYVHRQLLTDDSHWKSGDEYILARPLVHIYAEPDIKSSPLQLLFYPSRPRVIKEVMSKGGGTNRAFYELASGGFVLCDQLAPWGEHGGQQAAPLDLARRLLGTPYLWGGRSAAGIDCSGLVQVCYRAAGLLLPRDSGQQHDFLGQTITPAERRAGDVVFWPGHVGLLLDADHIIHAHARAMKVEIEPYEEVVTRLAVDNLPLRAIKRPIA